MKELGILLVVTNIMYSVAQCVWVKWHLKRLYGISRRSKP
jgi:hypothetical protein